MGEKRGNHLDKIPKRGQVTIFIIIAVVLVAGVAAYFIFRSVGNSQAQVPSDFQPAYNLFLSCIQGDALTGINVLESQGGYIYLPPKEPGSSYDPFSSQLDFLGNPIPYWYYLSENNLPKEQVPTVSFMESQLAQFIDSKIRNCDFGNYSSGIEIREGTPSSAVTINSNNVEVNLAMSLTFTKGDQTFSAKSHKLYVNSELGNLYKDAKMVYNYEQSSSFLENYTIDVLRNYAPVTGIDFKCSPETWNAQSVVNTLKQAIPENIMSLRAGGNKTDYFNVNLPVNGLSFVTSSSWPSAYEINPTQGSTMIAQPVGNQDGLGVLGFCYVPYHFVYSIKYPVLAVVRSGNELFQFPMAVVINNNVAGSSNATSIASQEVPLCSQGKENVSVNVYDSNSNPVNASISYECFGNTCKVGSAESGHLNGSFPQCVNGYIVATASGFKKSRTLFTTVQGGNINIFMDRLYNESVNLEVAGKPYSGEALITFTSSDGTSQTIAYPSQNSTMLGNGNYTIQVYVYENSSIKVGATTTQQCINIPSAGSLLVPGATQQQCFNVNVPAQVISNALSGGGSTVYYFSDSSLKNSKTITINAPSLQSPTSIQQLQTNYILVQDKKLSVSLS